MYTAAVAGRTDQMVARRGHPASSQHRSLPPDPDRLPDLGRPRLSLLHLNRHHLIPMSRPNQMDPQTELVFRSLVDPEVPAAPQVGL